MIDNAPTVTIKVPDKNSPGFARRLYRAAQFQERIKAEGFTSALLVSMIDFLSDYVEGDREQAKEYLWDCTEEQFNKLIGAVTGGSAEQIPPPKLEPTVTP